MRVLIRVLMAVMACGLLTAGTCQSPSATFDYSKLKGRCEGNYQLEAGDVIRVNVWNEPNHSQESVLVRPDGKISLPLVGDIHAAGLSVHQLTKVVKQKVAAFVPNPRVDISLVNAKSYQIFVVGEVGAPGTFTPQSQINVVQALALAGGLTSFAKKKEIVIVWKSHKGEFRIPFDYEAFMEGKNKAQNIILCRDDTVLVP